MTALRGRGGRSIQLVILATFLFCKAGLTVRAQSPSGGQTVDAFFAAIQAGDTNTVFKMLDGNTNLVHALYYGRLPLHVAAQKGRVAIVARLLHSGADINEENDSLDTSGCHLTALDIAIWYNHPEVVRLLLESGANPNLLGYQEGSALHVAFLFRRTAMAGWLLDHGANPFLENQFPYNHATPIDLAIERAQGGLVPQMLKLKSRFEKNWTRTNIIISRFNFNRKPVKTASEVIAERGGRWLSAAAQRGELDVVKALFKAGVVASTNSAGRLTMMQSFSLAAAAAERGQHFDRERWLRIRDQFISHGAGYDAFAATALDDTNQVKQLLAADHNVLQARDGNGQTLLHWTVLADNLPMASFWIDAGVPLNATNHAGQTALYLAAAQGKTEFVKTLLAANASTSIRDTNGWTALDVAGQKQQAACIHLLLPKTAGSHAERGLSTPLHQAAASGNIAALAAALETQTNLEAHNELGLTPLEVAVKNGHLAAAAMLVDRGANINARDPEGNNMLQQVIPRYFGFVVRDRPPTNWLDRLGNNPLKAECLKCFAVGRNGQPPNAILETVSFLLAGGIDVKATNNAGRTAMHLALNNKTVLFDDREPLLRLLKDAGSTVEQRDAEGNTALHRAVRATDASESDTVAALIAAGADVNATNFAGQTPLHLAAEKIGGWDELPDRADEPFQALIKAKANVNAQDNEGLTPLDVLGAADTSFKAEATRALLDAGANPNLRDKRGRTAVDWFLSGKWPWSDVGPCLEMLVKAGANLNARDDEGKTPLHYLAGLGHQNPLFFIRGIDRIFSASHVNFNARDHEGDTPLHIAARTGTGEVFDWLLKHGANLDATNNAGETPRLIVARKSGRRFQFGPANAQTDIFTAAREGTVDALGALIKADAGLANATNGFGQTPLRVAIVYHRTNAVHFLEQHGAHWDMVSSVLAGNSTVLRKLLATQPHQVDAKYYGSSLLNLAAARGYVECVNVLLAAGASLRTQDLRGLSPLGVAMLNHRENVVNVLRQHGAAENIFDAAYTGNATAAAALLRRHKALATATNSSGVSVLAIAAGTGHAEVLTLLLTNGASVRVVDARAGQTPLDLAAIYNQSNTARLLLRHGARVNVGDKFGFAPLHLAVLRGADAMVEFLLKNNADVSQLTAEPRAGHPGILMMHGPNAIRFYHESALHLAAAMCETNIIQQLLTAGAPVNVTDGMGRTPLDLAYSVGWPPTAFWMQQIIMRTDPLGLGAAFSTFHPQEIHARQKAVVSILERAGGKSLQPHAQHGMPLRIPR